MKVRYPLLLKIGVWLGLNLLLVVAVGLAVLFWRGGISGWLREPITNRLQLLSEGMGSSLREGASLEEVLEKYEETYGLSFMLFVNDGAERLAGPEWELPAIVQSQLGGVFDPNFSGPDRRFGPGETPRGNPGGPPPPRAQEGRSPTRPSDARPRPTREEWTRGGPPPPPRNPAEAGGADRPARHPEELRSAPPESRILEYDRTGGRWWAGVRMPLPLTENRRPEPATLLAISDSAWSFGGLLDLRPLLMVGGGVLLFSILFWLPLVAGITRALRQAVRATHEIARGNFEVRLNHERQDELGVLGDSINRMAGRLDSLVNGQKKFLADIAHELGSPVGRLQVGAAILEERVPDALKPTVADVQEEVHEMSDLLSELLAFTQAGLQAREAAIQPVVLRDVVDEAVRREAGEAGVAIEMAADTVVGGNATLLVKVVSNLLRNAVRYAGKTATIMLQARTTADHHVEFVVMDDGPGVPAESLERLGEPFYRPDAARSREMGGTGLGLSIVRESIEAMGGQVTFANRDPHGFAATITLSEVVG